MAFPITLSSKIKSNSVDQIYQVVLRSGVTVLVGPNGSGKTQLLRGLRPEIQSHTGGKKTRFISAGRIGALENSRSDFDGYRGGNLLYDDAEFGSKGEVERRHNIETLKGDFQTLAQRPDIQVKIKERLKKLFRRDLLIEWDAGSLKVKFARFEKGSQPYSSGREASGLLHLVGILTALYDDEIGALLLDEPEVSLHPQLQAFLANEVRAVAGHPSERPGKKLVVIATHSTEMLHIARPLDLTSLVFCHDVGAAPVQIDPAAGELENKKIRALVARLGQEHKLALFSDRPLLVEGPSDVIICTAIATKLERHLEAAGSQLLPVVGKGQMPVVRKLFAMMGKHPVLLVDGDAVADGLELPGEVFASNPIADTHASSLGFPTAHKMAQSIQNDFAKLVADDWATISPEATKHPYWMNRGQGEDTGAARRAALATLFNCTEEKLTEIDGTRRWLSMRRRFSALYDLMEQTGCFVLRRGAIESYYRRSDPLTSAEKPTAAAAEMEHIDQLGPDEVEALYPEIARCVVFASRSQAINEAEALRDVLLSVAAPALAKLQAGATKEEIALTVQSLAGDRAKLFEFDVDNDVLQVSLGSSILKVTGFPIHFAPGENVIDRVNKALNLSS